MSCELYAIKLIKLNTGIKLNKDVCVPVKVENVARMCE